MTKRFYLLNYNNFPIYDSLNDKEYNAQFKKQRENLCELLNEQHETIQRLKQNINELLSVNVEEELVKENELLKQRNKRLQEKIQRERTSFTKTHERWSKEAENKIKELSEENEQLKSDVYDWKASAEDYLKLGKSLKKENEQLKSENNMLKITIGRNENYIARLTHTGEWKDTSKPLYRSISRGD